MPHDSYIHKRKSIRLQGYDYTQPGAYFVTINTYLGRCLFGKIHNGEMQLNAWGKIIFSSWTEIPNVYKKTAIDEFIVMPNHLHGIIFINETAYDPFRACTGGPIDHASRTGDPLGRPYTLRSASLGSIIGQFKAAATKQIIRSHSAPRRPIWHRNYWDHIIRNEYELSKIREYIRNNPLRWGLDDDNTGGPS